MLKFTRVITADAEASALTDPPNLTLWLTHEERARSRHVAMTADGSPVALLLPRGTALLDGMVVGTDDGQLALIRAAAQSVLCVRAASPLALLRLVYHLANRHVPMQIAADHALIEPDLVLEKLAVALGGTVETLQRPFEPEIGAYRAHAHHPAHGALVGSPLVHSHGLDAQDAAAGRIGEQLSIAAHAARGSSGPVQK